MTPFPRNDESGDQLSKIKPSSTDKRAGRSLGLTKSLLHFLVGVRERYVSTLDVIDEALQSKQLKDRMWAVELLLKKLSPTRLLHDLSSFSQLFQTKKTELTQTSKASSKQGAANDLLVDGAEWNHLSDEQLQEELSRLFDSSLSPDKDSSTGESSS